MPQSSDRALVTGSAQRIGRAIATALAQFGLSVAVQTRRSRSAAEGAVADIVAAGGRARVVEADLADHDAVLRSCRRPRSARSRW
jgi:NAD(P)-dependent dehydrogenase (short-subunit alcohol dehydrogenase family)